VVGHGGYGTTMTALAAGVPQILVPLFSLDQHDNARRLNEIGALGVVSQRGLTRSPAAAVPASAPPASPSTFAARKAAQHPNVCGGS
jgi:UDP-N-acetylglucosamine:LPS N-acetylglucosamine transferase